MQAYEIVIVKNKEQKEKLAEAAFGQDFIAQAPLNLVYLANPKKSAMRYGSRGINLYCIQDATIAVSYAQLAATALGLASCWVGAFDDEEVKKVVNATDLIPVAIVPIGYPVEEPYTTPRRKLEDLVKYETFK